MLAFLVIATIVDLGLAGLLVAISGFIFGGGPEGLSGDFGAAAAWTAAFIGCLAAPAAGFILRRRGYPGAGAAAAFVPVLLGLTMAFGGA
jgi:hypothetical protein